MSETPAVYNPKTPVVFDAEQIDLIKNQIAKGVSDNELALFVSVCQRTGLDPFGPEPEIYAIVRKSKAPDGSWKSTMVMQVAIAGLRKAAENSGLYGGQLGPLWCDHTGKWTDVWLPTGDKPTAAKVGIIRNDWKEPLWAVAKYSSYVQKGTDGNPTRFWQQAPDLMLALAAERLAIRKAFPHQTRGLGSDYLGELNGEPTSEDLKPIVSPKAAAQLAAAGFNVEPEMVVNEEEPAIEAEFVAEPEAPKYPPYTPYTEVPVQQAGLDKGKPATRQQLTASIARYEKLCEQQALAYPSLKDNPTDLELANHVAQLRAITEAIK